MRNRPPTVAASFSAMKAEYAMSTESRFRRRRAGVSGVGAPGDYHYASEAAFIRGREYVRAMHRDDAVIGPTTRKAVQQHIQTGFRLDPQTGDKKLDRDLKDRWHDWAHDPDACDAAGEMEFPDMESAVFEAMLVDGDVFALPIADEADARADGTLQLIEADRVRTPTKSLRNIVHGVELDARRRRTRFYFAKDQVGIGQTPRRYERLYDFDDVAARGPDGGRQVFHVFHPDRVTQTRGVTAYKAIVDVAGMWEDTNFALLVKQQFAAALAWFLKRDANAGGYESDLKLGARSTERQADNTDQVLEEIAPGQVVRGKPGEDLKAVAGQIPSHETMAHMRFLLQLIGINLGLPLILVLLDAAETNFSGWRGAMDMARLGFRCNQRQLIRRFHKPVYGWKLRQWAAEDPALAAAEARLGAAFGRHRWHTPTWPYIQPLQDAQANALRLSSGMASERQVAAEDGRDYDEILREHVADRTRAVTRAIRAAQRIEARTGVSVHWRDVLNQDLPQGAQAADTIEEENTAGGSAPAKPAVKGQR